MRLAFKASNIINRATTARPTTFLPIRDESLSGGDLITHEFSHSWNGKYRRPADLTTPNFQVPQHYRSALGLRGHEPIPRRPALVSRRHSRAEASIRNISRSLYAQMDYETGRATTPLIDLTTGAPYFYLARGVYPAIRRNADDFYTEGELLWLDVDTIIRERSHGARSLDTFLHRFTEPSLTGPIVVTYTRAQVESLLNGVEPYDWHAFFDKYVYHVAVHPPTDELARAGWRLDVHGASPTIHHR